MKIFLNYKIGDVTDDKFLKFIIINYISSYFLNRFSETGYLYT